MKRIAVLIIFITICQNLPAISSDRHIRFGFQSGVFEPSDAQVQGLSVIDYNSDGTARYLDMTGFGDGIDISAYVDYWRGTIGLRVESGALLFRGRKIIDATHRWNDEYENILTVIPVTFSLLRTVNMPRGRCSSYLGFGGGIYFTTWEERQTFNDPVMFDIFWLKQSQALLGTLFLAGFKVRVWEDFSLSLDGRYSYIGSDWELEGQFHNWISKRENINIGGISLKLGVCYEFQI